MSHHERRNATRAPARLTNARTASPHCSIATRTHPHTPSAGKRHIFATETVNGGLPIHIAAKLLGHLDLNTTQGYVAVYPQEVIHQYRRYIDQRRSGRPSLEYREPTDAEWQEFRDHFSLRKVALGTCERPYGTPCEHFPGRSRRVAC